MNLAAPSVLLVSLVFVLLSFWVCVLLATVFVSSGAEHLKSPFPKHPTIIIVKASQEQWTHES
jgi:hypothetical protein